MEDMGKTIGNLSSKHSKTIKNLYIVLPLDQEISEEFQRGKTAGYIYIKPESRRRSKPRAMEVPGILGRALPVVDKFHHSYRLLGVVSQFIGGYHGYPLVNVYSLLLKMAIEIVDLPMNSMVISIVSCMFNRK